MKLDSKYCDSRAAKGYTHMTSSPEVVPFISICSHNKRQHRKVFEFRCISDMPWGNIDCSIVVSLFPVRKITRTSERWTKASDVKLPMSLFDKSSVVRFCRKLDKNPDGIFLIRQLDKFKEATEVSTKAEFGTVVMTLCDRSRDWRWMLRNTPASKLVILFDPNCTLFNLFMF